MKRKIKLGDTVQCKHSGIKGVVVAKIQFINGCIQFTLTPKANKKALVEPVIDVQIDEKSLKIIKKRKEFDYEYLDEMKNEAETEDETEDEPRRRNSSGGPTTRGIRMKGH